eukprot:Partr_v1_DN28844_c2_g1_i3_m33850 putative F-box and WD repeat domain containing 7, E3 ubiquitin protein ligase
MHSDTLPTLQQVFNDEKKMAIFAQMFRQQPLATRHKLLSALLRESQSSDLALIHSFVQTSSKLRIDFISELPDELSVIILSYLPGESCVRASRVSKSWYRLFHDNDLWRRICQRDGFESVSHKRMRYDKSLARRDIRSYASSSSTSMVLLKSPGLIHMSSSWKRHFIDNYLTQTNWISGKCVVRPVKLRSAAPSPTNDDADVFDNDIDDSLTFSFDDSLQTAISISSANARSNARLWDTLSGAMEVDIAGHVGTISAVKLDCDRIVTGGVDRTVRVWDRNSGRCLVILEGHLGEIDCLQVAGDMIVSGSQDQTIRVSLFLICLKLY